MSEHILGTRKGLAVDHDRRRAWLHLLVGGSLNDLGRGIDYFAYWVFVVELVAGCPWAALTI